MKFILPHGGYGLGNDLIPWAKAFILARELGAKLLHPAWGNNPRKYYKYFQTSRFDYQWYRILRRTLPRLRFCEEDYRRIGINEFSESSRIFGQENDMSLRSHYILEITGFWGAFGGLETAKDFILSRLMSTAFTQENLFAINKRLSRKKLTIGVHIRLGDFRPAGTVDYQGAEQASLPIDWYCGICDQLEAFFGPENLQFVVCSDGERTQLMPLLKRKSVLFTSELPNSDISDLLALIYVDLLICSVSSYSMWAAFLSRSSYIWYRPNLVENRTILQNKFIRSLGIHSSNEINPQNKEPGRSIAIGIGDLLPEHLLSYLKCILRKKKKYHLVRDGEIA